MGKAARQLLACTAVLTTLASPAAAETAERNKSCKKSLSAKGIPHRIKTIAQFNAVRAWTELSSRRGANYGLWHNARSHRIECEKPERSDYHSCTAKAKPCLPPKTASAQKQE